MFFFKTVHNNKHLTKKPVIFPNKYSCVYIVDILTLKRNFDIDDTTWTILNFLSLSFTAISNFILVDGNLTVFLCFCKLIFRVP